jgi:hypothetical protein
MRVSRDSCGLMDSHVFEKEGKPDFVSISVLLGMYANCKHLTHDVSSFFLFRLSSKLYSRKSRCMFSNLPRRQGVCCCHKENKREQKSYCRATEHLELSFRSTRSISVCSNYEIPPLHLERRREDFCRGIRLCSNYEIPLHLWKLEGHFGSTRGTRLCSNYEIPLHV